MLDESKLIFFTGAPGSKWSAISHLLTYNNRISIDTSDYSSSRYYLHKKYNTAHQGAYWGPGFGLGEKFNDLQSLSKQEILAEIYSAYSNPDDNKFKIIKCHQFSLQLDYIKEVFPSSKIMIVFRPWLQCEEGWINAAGGFDSITYPNYSPYYKDVATMKQHIYNEVNAAGTFINKNINNVEFDLVHEKYWLNRWGIQRTPGEVDHYMTSVESRTVKEQKVFNFDISLALFNF